MISIRTTRINTKSLHYFDTAYLCLPYESHNKTVSAKRAAHVSLMYGTFSRPKGIMLSAQVQQVCALKMKITPDISVYSGI